MRIKPPFIGENNFEIGYDSNTGQITYVPILKSLHTNTLYNKIKNRKDNNKSETHALE